MSAFLYIQRPKLEEPFTQMLETRAGSLVLNLHSNGESGMGKTYLLRRYLELCEEKGVPHTKILDFRQTINRYRSRLIWIVTDLDPDKEHGVFAEYWKQREEYEGARKLGKETFEAAYKELEEAMDRSFIKGLNTLLSHGKLVIMLDTWEAVANTPLDEWLHRLLSGRLQSIENMHNLILVISGRDPLIWSDIPVKHVFVGPFDFQETRNYAYSRGYDSPSDLVLIKSIHKATGGHPVLVAWAFDYARQGADIKEIALNCQDDVSAFRQKLVEMISPTENIVLAWAACLHRRFNPHILHHISEGHWSLEEARKMIDKALEEFPSILRRGVEPDSCELHDKVRDIIIEAGWQQRWDPTRDSWIDLRKRVIDYYEQQLHKVNTPALIEAYTVERLFYMLDNCIYVNVTPSAYLECLKKVFYESFLPVFNGALDAYQIGLARSLLAEISKFKGVFDRELSLRHDVIHARILTKEGEFDTAIKIYEKVLEQAEEYPEVMAEVHMRLGRCYYFLARYKEAMEAYQRGLKLYEKIGVRPRVAEITRYVGMALKALGKWEKALEQYEESYRIALEISTREGKSEAASAADQAAQVAILLGDASMARALARQALYIYKELGDRFGEARALTTLGRVEEFARDLRQAEHYLNQADKLYSIGPTPSILGRAIARIYLGRVYRRQNRFDEAEKYERESKTIFERLNAKPYLAFAFNELGCTYREKGEWDKAMGCFIKAIDIANEIKDTFRLSVVYEDICVLLRKRGDPPEKIEEELSITEKIAKEYGYKLTQARVEVHRGDLAYEAGDYRTAFTHYAKACHFFAEYNRALYHRFLNSLEDKLWRLSLEEIPKYCDQIIKYWKDNELHIEHPTLIRNCNRVKEMALRFGLKGGDE